MQKKLGLFLLSYKRPDFIKEAIASILSQDYEQFDLIISENSPDDSVMNILDVFRSDSRVQVIKRNPSLPSLEHFKKVLSEVNKYEYAMLFHDDDILMPSALKKMLTELENHPEATAVACNANLIKNTDHTDLKFNTNLRENIVVKTQSELINRYIVRSLSHTPFPAYIYRTKYLPGVFLDPKDGGKYSDVSFLVKLITNGPFIWLAEPLMKYRQHSQNDSVQIELRDIKLLSYFFLKTSPKLFPKIIFYYSKQLLKKIYLRLFGQIKHTR